MLEISPWRRLANKPIWAEAFRFGLVGLKSNAIYYLLYVLLTFVGVVPNVAVTVVYTFGIFYAYWFNREWVFKIRSQSRFALARYVAVYVAAWATNLYLLNLATIRFGMGHYIAQAGLIVLISGLVFLSLKVFVFRPLGE